ncbi:hypothetical protein IWZ00DRAFT_278803 [Phyllosticta capitalensis]
MAGIRTYDEIPEHTFSPRDPSHRVYGRSIYRGLARQLLGDPGNFNDIIGEVLHHFLRVFFNPQHPLHGQYRLFDEKNFYYNLSRPDLSDSRDTLLKALKIISNALRIEIILHENDSKKYLNTKIGSTFENHAQCRLFIRRREMHYVAFSMIPEDSGQDIINYMRLQNTIGEGWILNIKRIKWWWNPESDSTNFECANEFVSEANFDSTPPLRTSLPDASGKCGYPAVFSNFVVSVKTPIEIKPAMDLLLNILPLSPGQGIPVNVDLSKADRKTHATKGRLLPYVGIDAEFKLVSHDKTISEKDLQNMANDDGSEAENLCTVLTIAVDRHVTFHFYIFHMLEEGYMDTVSELEYLWRKVIFNEEILKIWFNFQSDITVLDNTIAHLYQGTAREPYYLTPGPGRQMMKIEPRWRLTRPQFRGQRPGEFIFSNVDTCCPFHKPREKGTGRDIACPCRTRNLDLETIIAHVRRQVGLYEISEETVRSWTKERRGFGYVKLLQQFLGNDWMFPILNYLKDAPNRWAERNTQPEDNDEDGEYGGGGGGKPNKAGFFRSFGPSMESDSDKLGYNIGDVGGIALIFRFLTTTEDRKLLFARLRNISDNEQKHTKNIKPQQTPFDKSTRGALDQGTPLITDNPRSWTVDTSRMWDDTKDAPWIEQSTYFANCNHSYAAHENLIKTVLSIKRDESMLSPQEIREKAKHRLYDPCRFELPPMMARVPKIPDKFKPPVIQGMEMHCEDIYRKIFNFQTFGRMSNLILPPDILPYDLRSTGSAGTSKGENFMDDEMTRAVRAVRNQEGWERSTETPMTIREYLPIAIDRAVSRAKAEVDEVTAESAAQAQNNPSSTMGAKDQDQEMDIDTTGWGNPPPTKNIPPEIPEEEMKDAEPPHSDPEDGDADHSYTEEQELLDAWPYENPQDGQDRKNLPLKAIDHLAMLKKKLAGLRWSYRVKPDDVFDEGFDDWGQKYAERVSEAPPFEQDHDFSASNATRIAKIQECFDEVNARINGFKNDLEFWDADGRKEADEALKNPTIFGHESSTQNGRPLNAGPSQIHRAEKKRATESSAAPLRRSKRIRKEPDRFANSSQ